MSYEYEHEREEDLFGGRGKKAKDERLNLRTGRGSSGGGARKPPQAIVKVAGWASTSGSVRNMIRYIGRADGRSKEEELEVENHNGGLYQGQDDVDSIHARWHKDFKRRKPGVTRKPRHAVHMIFSAKGDKENPKHLEAVKEAARIAAQKQFQGKYDYVLGVHQDGTNPHAHLIVNTTPRGDEKLGKLRIGPQELMELKRAFAKELTKRGLKHVAQRPKTKRRSKPLPSNWKNKTAPSILKRTETVIDRLRKEDRGYRRKMKREQPRVDALRHKYVQRKALETLEKRINLVTVEAPEKTNERIEAQGKLNQFKRTLSKGGKQMDPVKEFEATAMFLAKEAEKLEKEYVEADKNKQADSPEKVMTRGKPKDLEELDQKNEKFQKRLNGFMQEMNKSDLEPEKKKELFQLTRPKQQNLKKFQTRERTR
jgi:hypothetical protein